MAKCICLDWRENIGKVDQPHLLQAIRRGREYTGKFFSYCPWCGSELELEASDYAGSATEKP